jgi:nitrogen regulatory protein P-II 1
MKLITAVVKPEKLEAVIRAVETAGARGLTATESVGFGQEYGHLGQAAPADQSVLVMPKVRIEVVVHDQLAEQTVEAIARSANTGTMGDGKIWVCPVDSAVRVRTGDRDDAAV